jgi:hypothetical protein
MRAHSGASSICAEGFRITANCRMRCGGGSHALGPLLYDQASRPWHWAGPRQRVRLPQAVGSNATIYSEPGRGTTVNLYLPVVATQETLVDPGSDKEANAAGGAALREVLSHVA